ncbi:YfmQ family protein [Metabacillus sp. GX 13764]|uniref:YfmQ family protein n=1 Tax=Metabacillus kandeliae TaxID=2900151 RepID=UPI001E65599E|nr:YfmQ family protein [Metabacillus kandeliae]MCD7035693.1 YfmQ family protein [Metabacillus kandeliae]
MTWVIVTVILASLVKILVTSMPSFTIDWLMGKTAVHQKLSEQDTDVSIGGHTAAGEEKASFIRGFNEAIYIEKYYIYPGDEEAFLHPENGGTALIVNTKFGKSEAKLFIYRYKDRVDVVKQYKKKVIAYSLQSAQLQEPALALA